ncbi:MAG TPA: NAD(P)H-dependent oxidoreductase [Spirochaetota bacterium]|nr:NAD(P)H-dependent oxidoreductase [Spirochaetota bacterium]HPJ40295.1 NAD(P)H-dependent oxidoreductase [Spirochaetota bacterium]HPQ54166.1 NAD(P)H-dependent oxidoreductase [Spirochaetota bacterium]
MNVMVIYDHPWEGSYCNAVLQQVIQGLKRGGHHYDVLDLQKDGFDPIMRAADLALYSKGQYSDPKVGEYQSRIEKADHLFFIFPIWWEVMPAYLKGFCDKVFLNNWAYEKTGLMPKGKLTFIKGATVITTMGTPGILYRLKYGNAIEKAFNVGTLKFCGIKKVKWINLGRVDGVTQKKREKWLSDIGNYACALR